MMKNTITLLGMLLLIVSLSLPASAASFETDVNYFFGTGDNGGVKMESRGYAFQASAQVLAGWEVDGSFLRTDVTKLAAAELPAGTSLKHQVSSFGGSYQVLAEQDLQVIVGGGYLELTARATSASDLKGKGIYGRLGLTFTPMANLRLRADLSYAPKFKVAEVGGTFLQAKATLAYQIYNDFGLQGTVQHYKSTASNLTTTNHLVGAGIVLSF